MIRSLKPIDAFMKLFLIVSVLLLIDAAALSQGPANANTANANAGEQEKGKEKPSNSGSQENKNGSPPANTSPKPNPTNDKLPQCPTVEEFGSVSVKKVFVGSPNSGAPRDAQIEAGSQVPEARLGDVLGIELSNLAPLLARAKCTNPNKKIVLFLDGRPVKDATPFPPSDPVRNELRFTLLRTENSRDFWTYLLGSPSWSPRFAEVSVGLEDEYPVQSTAKIQIQVLPHGWFFFWAIIFAGLAACFLLLALRSNLLRDSGPEPETGSKPFSLARTQAAWWFFLVLASYLFIGIVTGDFSTSITSTVLGLLGISAATVVGSAIIDSAAVGAASTSSTAMPTAHTGRNFYTDLLSETGTGVSFHRFQILAWTLILGIIFVVQVYRGLAMPTFDNTLLALLGISAGTFLGIKTQGKG